jgi:hypothetical protein
MNIDIFSTIQWNDAPGLQNFLLVHRFVHEETANALTARFLVPVTSFGLEGEEAQIAWTQLMASGKTPPEMPLPLKDWLKLHADMHTQSYGLLGQSSTVAPDLSVVDFSQRQQFDDWMFVHQSMHDFEYQQLGLM